MESPEESAISEIVLRLRALLPRRAVPSNVSRDFWMPDHSCGMCYECDSQFTMFNRRHHCRLCGRVFCRKCTQNKICASADEREDEECIRVCKFCFNQREQEVTGSSCGETPYMTPQISPSPSDASFVSCSSSFNGGIGIGPAPYSALPSQHFSSGYAVEKQHRISCVKGDNFVSPVAGLPSTTLPCNIRTDGDDENGYVKDSEVHGPGPFRPSRECFNNDTVTDSETTNALDNFHTTDLTSQGPTGQAAQIFFLRKSENLEINDEVKNSCFQSDGPFEGRLSRLGEESDDMNNADECIDESSVFPSSSPKPEQPNPDIEQPLDIESTDHIWTPPEPEDEDDEKEFSMLDDDDDDGGLPCSLDSFGSKESRRKDRSSEEHKKGMKAVVDGHFRALVAQLLMAENIPVGEENDNESWLEIITSLAWQAATLVKPDASEGRGMDPGGYVKVKCIACGHRSESQVIKGVVFKKNVAHKHMTTKYKNPRLLLLGGALEYQRVSNQLSSFDTLLQQEIDYLKFAVARIEAYHPNVLLVEKTVSRHAQEYLLSKEISLVLDVKRPRLERIARCTGAQIVSSLDNLLAPKLKHCELFHVEKFVEEHGSAGEAGKKLTKTLMFFEGCPRPLGCTVLLKGANGDELKKVKRVVQYAVFAAYHLALETSFLADERATLPDITLRSPVNALLPDKQASSEGSNSTIHGFTFPIQEQEDTGELQMQTVYYKPISTSPPLSSSALNYNGAGSKPSGSLSHVGSMNSSAGTSPAQTSACFNMLSSPRTVAHTSEGMPQKDTYSAYETIQPSSASSGYLISGLSASLKKALGDALPLISSGSYGAITSYLGIKERELQDSPIDNVPAVSVASKSLHCEMALEEVPDELQMECPGINDNQIENLPIVEQKNRDAVQCEDQVSSREALPPLSDHQSILVSLSSRCVSKGTVCERGRLSRIKYYGSFDKSLGRFLQDKLFDQNSRCPSCDQPPEDHDHCYTHQQGRLTISVRRIHEELVLPGEREGKIWMWHRCLKCAQKMGVSQATRRVVMSEAAWGLSFGKFLELSFSNHAAASRVASCGHSLHRDCLRFYGFGDRVACFRYSSINVYSVHLPPPKLNFNDPKQQEWLRKEATEVAEKGEILFAEVLNLIHRVRERIATTGSCLGVNALELRRLVELEGMLETERIEFVESLQKAITKDWQPGQPVADILELNRLRWQIIFEFWVWDNRLRYLHSSLKIERSAVGSESLPEHLNVSMPKESNNSEQPSQGADKHDKDCDVAKIPEAGRNGCMVDRNGFDGSGVLQCEEVSCGADHAAADACIQSPSIPGSLQNSFLTNSLTQVFSVDERLDEGMKAAKLEGNTGAVLLDQVQTNVNEPVGEMNTVGPDVTNQAVSIENGKCCTCKCLSGNRSVGAVDSRNILDFSEEDLGASHCCTSSDLSVTLDAVQIGDGSSVPMQDTHMTSDGYETVCTATTVEKTEGCPESALKMVSDSVQPSPVTFMVNIGSGDLSCNTQDKDGFELPSTSMPTSPLKSFDNLEGSESWIWLPFSHLYKGFCKGSQGSLSGWPLNFESTSGYVPALLSSGSKMIGHGGDYLLLPTGVNDTVIAVYDDEPTSVIAYALASQQYQAQISEKVTEEEKYREKDGDTERETEDFSGMDTIVSFPLQNLDGSLGPVEIPSERRSSSTEDVSTSGSSGSEAADLLLFTNVMHAEVFFGDESAPGKGKYSVICYFAKRFHALRKRCCPTEMEFIRSLSRCKKWGAQGGKSKVFFAKTLDDRFIIKQVTKTELESFFKFAPEYFKHLSYSLSTGSPTCLAKILGIYQVTVKHAKGGKDVKMDLMVMENLLFGRSPTQLYDLKGSLRSRYNSDSTGTNKVLLDQNFIQAMQTSPFFVGNKAKHLLERAVWNDTSFLTSINVMDYSLLVGVDEQRGELVLGIIDFMRQYTWDKHLETWVKASGILGGPKNESPTVISPKQYKKRFRKAMSTYFPTVPDPWSPSTIPSPSQIFDAGENGTPLTEDIGEQVTKSNA